MTMNCAICKRTHDLFTLEFEEGETEEPYKSHVCGKCWEHIAAIATRAMGLEMKLLSDRVEKLEAGANE